MSNSVESGREVLRKFKFAFTFVSLLLIISAATPFIVMVSEGGLSVGEGGGLVLLTIYSAMSFFVTVLISMVLSSLIYLLGKKTAKTTQILPLVGNVLKSNLILVLAIFIASAVLSFAGFIGVLVYWVLMLANSLKEICRQYTNSNVAS